MTVHHRLRAGAYGRTVRVGRIIFADVEGVEDFHGVTFEQAQLAAAAGKTDRLIAIPMPIDPEIAAEVT
jgi:hypothetical protein